MKERSSRSSLKKNSKKSRYTARDMNLKAVLCARREDEQNKSRRDATGFPPALLSVREFARTFRPRVVRLLAQRTTGVGAKPDCWCWYPRPLPTKHKLTLNFERNSQTALRRSAAGDALCLHDARSSSREPRGRAATPLHSTSSD